MSMIHGNGSVHFDSFKGWNGLCQPVGDRFMFTEYVSSIFL